MTFHRVFKGLFCLILLAGILTGMCVTSHARNVSTVEGLLYQRIQAHENSDFELNTLLTRAAEIHAGQIFIDEFATGRSEDHIEGDLSIESAGYRADGSESMSAMVVFSNYMPGDIAADLLFDTLIQTHGDQENGFDLVPEGFLEMGLHVLETSISFSGSRFNVYLAVVNFAVPVRQMTQTRIMEAQLLNLINQVRQMPSAVMEWNQLDTMPQSLAQPAPPLISMPVDAPAAVFINTVASEDIDQNNMVASLFYFMLLDERIMDSAFNIADIKVEQQMIQMEGRHEMSYTSTVKMDRTDIPVRALNGMVFSDLNGNNLYDAGEEFPHVPLFVNDAGIHSRTGAAGNFYEILDTDTGVQLILFPGDQEMVIRDIDRITEDQFIMINW